METDKDMIQELLERVSMLEEDRKKEKKKEYKKKVKDLQLKIKQLEDEVKYLKTDRDFFKQLSEIGRIW